jgi:hypothetical protein
MFSKADRINVVNIGLMLISCAASFVMPFEVFLFAYAVLGPLHYLTEISWLHDRQYFSKGKYDYLVLVSIGIIITWDYLSYRYQIWPYDDPESSLAQSAELNIYGKFLLLALFGSVIMAYVKNGTAKLVSLFFLFAFINNWLKPEMDEAGNPVRKDSTLVYVLTSFIPTLIHVYVFTGFFILYGALKSRSRSGLLSVAVFLLCPLLLAFLFREHRFMEVTSYGINAYGTPENRDGFFGLSQDILYRFFGYRSESGGNLSPDQQWIQFVYHSQTGVLLMRCIAFAYLYHYLNWFSKTEVIKWHQVPRKRLLVVAAVWIASLVLYAYDYAVGLQWLFFLSFSHVLLEFPLNALSIAGTGKETIEIFRKGFRSGKKVQPA